MRLDYQILLVLPLTSLAGSTPGQSEMKYSKGQLNSINIEQVYDRSYNVPARLF